MKNIIETDISIRFQPKLILYAVGCIYLMCTILCFTVTVSKLFKGVLQNPIIIGTIIGFIILLCDIQLLTFMMETIQDIGQMATPVAVSSYAMAVEMNCDEQIASQAVVVTTIFSILSMISWIFSLDSMGLL